MATKYSRPIEDWTEERKRVDVLVVGSGYGGSVAAYRLASETRSDVVVLERGKEYAPGEFPTGLGDVPGQIQFRRPNDAQPIGYADGLYDIRFGDDVDVLVGSGLGGTSLINANVAVEPEAAVFQRGGWPAAIAAEAADPESSFRQAFRRMRVLLGPAPGPTTAKYAALETLASHAGAACTRADITVTLEEKTNAAGVRQAACTLCGNCVTGCNVGAKNTLAMNVIPLAGRHGARFFTGASVIGVERSADPDYPWRVRYRRTATIKKPLAAETYLVLAKFVVLAAGTLGSTEILKRSEIAGTLEFSEQLGRRFSTNGDGLAAGFAQAARVDAIGQSPQREAWTVGPTICGIAQADAPVPDTDRTVRLTIEDGAIPVALHHLFAELVTTGAQAARLVNTRLPAWLSATEGADPIAVHPEAMAHTQVLLVMGDDGSEGRLDLVETDRDGRRIEPHLKVTWKGAGDNDALRAADALLHAQDRKAGFGGGQYVANPMWKLLPDEASSVMSGKLPGGRVITVHPLGGCAMADDADAGVVNDRGQVYARGATKRRHEGLYVLDGAIVPRALGVNPFLTIGALAWRGCDALVDEVRKVSSPEEKLHLVVVPIVPVAPIAPDHMSAGSQAQAANAPHARPAMKRPHREFPRGNGIAARLAAWLQRRAAFQLLPAANASGGTTPSAAAASPNGTAPVEREVEIELTELLVGQLDRAPPDAVFGAPSARLAGHRGMLLHVRMEMPSVEGWYSHPGAQPLQAHARLYAHRWSAERVRTLHACELKRGDLQHQTLLAELEGTAVLFGRLPCNAVVRWWRMALAIAAYLVRRRGVLNGKLFSGLGGFLAVARNHADYRTMTYSLRGKANGHDLVLTGTKLLAWRPFHRRIWSALTSLPVELQIDGPSGRRAIGGLLGVHMEYMATDGIAQVRDAPHLPASVSALSGVGMYFVRALLQTSFWEFGAPDYPKTPIVPSPDWPVLRVRSRREPVQPVVKQRFVRTSERDDTLVPLWLTRYAQPAGGAQPVLLIHGLAQGSRIYSSEAMARNMAAWFWDHGYDVWLVDYRLSNRVLREIGSEDWSLEEIARYDIAEAVRCVHEATGRPLNVFAHCVGATTLAMAVLKGWLDASWLRCVAINAIHPWVMTSPVNRFRSALGTFFRDAVGRDLLDPIPQVTPSAGQVVLDRIAFSVARYNEERCAHPSWFSEAAPQAMCDRMTFLYGRMWRHENLERSLHDSFGDFLGPAPGSVYRHLYYFSKQGRLTDAQGQNVFLTEDNILAHWRFDTFFLHGELSEVFNPQSATRSAVRMRPVLDAVGPSNRRVWLKRVPGYGHMDVVFAQDAHERVYPLIENFFATDAHSAWAGPEAFDEDSDIDVAAPVDLTAGPVIRGAWAANGAVRAKLWGELHEDAASHVVALESVAPGTRPLQEHGVPHGEERYRMLEVEIEPNFVAAPMAARGDVVSRVRWPSGDEGVYFQLLDAGAEAMRPPLALAVDHRWSWLNRLRERAAGKPPEDALRFLVGSCRYPGTMFERDAADLVFAGMIEHLEDRGGRTGVDLLFLVGDQIYADATAGLADSKAWRERYSVRYREAMTTPHAAWVMASVPTHFALDDHEFSDDWSGLPEPGDPLPVDERANDAIAQARRAAACFQSAARNTGARDVRPRFWYALDDAETACPAFVMDTRSERRLRYARGGENAQLLCAGQWQALEQWLVEAQQSDEARPKFLLCGSVIAPVSSAYVAHPATFRNEDGWLGYPGEAARLLELVLRHRVSNLVIVAGDLHFSAVTRLEVEREGARATVWHVVSSGLYAPMPFANAHPEDVVFNGRLPIHGHDTLDVRARGAVLCEGEPHFVRIDAYAAEGAWRMDIGAHTVAGAKPPAGAPPDGAVAAGDCWTIKLQG